MALTLLNKPAVQFRLRGNRGCRRLTRADLP